MSRNLKRLIDLLTAFVALIVLLPAMAGVAVAIRVTMGSPVLFRQPRAGYRGQTFTVLKFRTMREAVGPDGKVLADAERLTTVGRFLRKTSLDELPQLWNVVFGQMSLVGPRPLLVSYLPHYTEQQARRHDVLPGITGLAQVRGRQLLVFSQRFELDVWYVDHWSLLLDLRLLLETVARIVRPRDVVLGQEVADVDDLDFSQKSS